MASLIEELIMVLGDEEKVYAEIIPVAEEKTRVIVNNDLQSLNSITEEEQALIGRISKLEKKRQEVIRNIGIVMNKKESELNFITIIDLLKGQEKEQEELRNQMLIKQSIEMIDFDINLMQSLRTSPGVGQYNTSSEVEIQGMNKGMFDAKS